MAIEIRETLVTPAKGALRVQLRISDAPLDDESAAFVLSLSVQIPTSPDAQLSMIQREALKVGSQALRDLLNA